MATKVILLLLDVEMKGAQWNKTITTFYKVWDKWDILGTFLWMMKEDFLKKHIQKGKKSTLQGLIEFLFDLLILGKENLMN